MRATILPALILFACGTRASSPVSPASAETPAAGSPIATWDGGQLTLGELEATVQKKLDAMESEHLLNRYNVLSQAMEKAVDDALLESEASKQGLPDPRALLQREIEEKATVPTPDEVAAFYEEVKPQLQGAPLDQVEGLLVRELMQRRMAEGYETYVAGLRKAAGVKGRVPYPDLKRVEVPLLPDDPVLGSPDAPVTIVQFAEYQCYYCNKVQPTLEALVADYDGKVKLVFKDFPLENHARAFPASVAARCAGEQDKYWEMNKVLLGNQRHLEDADLVRYATDLGLDTAAFDTCMASGRHDVAVRAAFEEGQRAGVEATPTFYVNGLLVSGAQPYDLFKQVIDQELATL